MQLTGFEGLKMVMAKDLDTGLDCCSPGSCPDTVND
jgi:hypothetical protein